MLRHFFKIIFLALLLIAPFFTGCGKNETRPRNVSNVAKEAEPCSLYFAIEYNGIIQSFPAKSTEELNRIRARAVDFKGRNAGVICRGNDLDHPKENKSVIVNAGAKMDEVIAAIDKTLSKIK